MLLVSPRHFYVAALFLVALANAGAHSSETPRPRSYRGFSVIRCEPKTKEQMEKLTGLTRGLEGSNKTIEFWTTPNGLGKPVDILVGPTTQRDLLDKLDEWQVPREVLIKDVSRAIEECAPSYQTGAGRRQQTHLMVNLSEGFATDEHILPAPRDFFSRYRTYNEIVQRISQLSNRNPLIESTIIGYSSERRPLLLVKVSSDAQARKPVVFIDAGHHARENMPKMSAAECKLEECEREATNRGTVLDLDRFDYWFMPVVNPDGYEYTHYYDRLWRKTRSSNGRGCRGVDPNRNYPYHWGETGTLLNPCSEIYRGPRPLSEPETTTLARTLTRYKDRIIMYVSLHAYSQAILSPWGYSRKKPENYAELERVATGWIQSTRRLRNTAYRFGTAAILMYEAAGGSDDFAYAEANIKLSFTIELPDTGRRGFILPPSEIVPVGQEAVLGLRGMTDTISDERLRRKHHEEHHNHHHYRHHRS